MGWVKARSSSSPGRKRPVCPLERTLRRGELAKVVEYVASQEKGHRLGKLSPVLERCEESDEDMDEEPGG